MRFTNFHRALDDQADDTRPSMVCMVTLIGKHGADEKYGIMVQSAGMPPEQKCIALGHLLRTVCDEEGMLPEVAIRIATNAVRQGYGPETAEQSEEEMLKRLKHHRSKDQEGPDASQDPSTGRG